MAAELEQLARDIKEKGFPVGAKLLKDISRSLYGQGLIPLKINQQTDLNQEVKDLLSRKSSYDNFREFGFSRRLSLFLSRKGFPLEALMKMSDADLLALPYFGKKRLTEFRQTIEKQKID